MIPFLARASSITAVVPLLSEIKAYFPEAGKESNGPIDWQVYEHNGQITVSWELTFRRSTRSMAFNRNLARIQEANRRLSDVAEKFKPDLWQISLCTGIKCKEEDDRAEENEGSAYSEYEQSIGGHVDFKSN